MAAAGRREGGQAWLATLLGILVLVAGGFVLGLIVGVVSEEPELVVGHVAGRSTTIAWAADGEPGLAPVAAPSPRHANAPATHRSVPVSAPPSAAAPIRSGATIQVASTSPAAPRRSAPAAAPVPVSEAAYAVQVGAFGTGKAAREVAADLRQRGYPVYVVEPESDTRWRVRVGPVQERGKADELARLIKREEQLPTWVLREQGG